MLLKIATLIKAHWRGFLMGVFVLALCLKVQSCTKAKYAPQNATKIVALPKADKEIITVSNGVVKITTAKGTTTVTGSRGTTITETKTGVIMVSEKTYGFEHQFGMNAYVSARMGLGVDFRGFFYKDIDCMVGLGYLPQTKSLDGWLGIGYTVHNSYFTNTTAFAGYSPMAHAPVFGISLKF